MADSDAFDAEYYFDVSSQQWWILNPGSSSWERLPQERVDELGLHSAVLREQCTFLDTSLADYEEAVSRMTVKNPADAKEGAVLKSVGCESTVDRQISDLNSQQSGMGRLSVDKYFVPSMSYSNIPSSNSLDRSNSSLFASVTSGRTDPTENEGPLEDKLIKHSSTRSHEKSVASLDLEDNNIMNGNTQWEKTSSFPGNIRRSGTSAQVIQNQLSHLIAETADIKRSYEAKQEKSIDKVESFVRSAVRHVTKSENSGIGDCIRAVAAERERMQKMATLKSDSDIPPKRYQRMMERARTMAAISLENDFQGKLSSRSSRNSLLLELQRVATKEVRDGYEGEATFDASSDSDGNEQCTSENGLESLMSQRLSLRRSLVRDPDSFAE